MNSIVLTWDKFKEFVATWNIKSSIRYVTDSNNLTHIWVKLDGQLIEVCSGLDAGSDELTDFQTNFIPSLSKSPNAISVSEQPAFASKSFGIKKLFKRVKGIQSACNSGDNTILFTIPFPWVKITGLEITNSESLDVVSLYVLDTETGTYSTVPNMVLNQFGFNVNVGKDYYEHKSEFDADLYQNMQIKIIYNSISSKTIGFNFILNEVKS